MIRSRRGVLPWRELMVVAAVGLVPLIAGCEAGFNAPTQQWHQPTPGASAVVNNTLRINNMFVLGPAPGFTLPRGASAGMFFALSNNGAPDRLISISAPGSASTVKVPVGGISVGHQRSLFLTGPQPRVALVHLTRTLNGGQYVVVTMDWLNAGRVTLRVPVMPRATYYGTYSPAPLFLSPRPSVSPVVAPTPAPSS